MSCYIIAGIIVIAIGAFLLSKALGYNKEVTQHIQDPNTNLNERGPDHWQHVEVSRSSTNLLIYSIGIMLVGIAMIVFYF